MAGATAGGSSLQVQFAIFAKFGDSKADGKTITLTNSEKWMKQAKIIDGKTITSTDTGICFNKMRSKNLTFSNFLKFLDELAKYRKVTADDLIAKLVECGKPGTSNTTEPLKVAAVARLTDTKNYTGLHKERFDESGQGKGLSGRKDVVDEKGYVSGYTNANTYDQTHE